MSLTAEEQKQQLTSFGKRYGLAIAVGILAILIAIFAWQNYVKRKQVERYNRTVELQNIINRVNVAKTDTKVYQALLAETTKLVADDADNAQAVQAQLLMAKLAFDKQDFATANRLLSNAQNAKIDDEGLLAIVKLHLAYTQAAQNQLDTALQTLATIKVEAFAPTVSEAKGDILVAQNKPEEAKKAYQTAWDILVKRKQPREILQIKLADLGVSVEMPAIDKAVTLAEPTVATVEGTAASDSAAQQPQSTTTSQEQPTTANS